jgi:hypothetical protein
VLRPLTAAGLKTMATIESRLRVGSNAKTATPRYGDHKGGADSEKQVRPYTDELPG